jgi:hypothetical protein
MNLYSLLDIRLSFYITPLDFIEGADLFHPCTL